MSDAQQYCSFMVGDLFLGVDVRRVQEVLRHQPMTGVPLAPPDLRGLINLRGQIVPAIDLRRRLGLDPAAAGAAPMNVVVRDADGPASLLVDEIGDVVSPDPASLEDAPPTLRGPVRELVAGVYKLDGRLMLVLDTERALAVA
ncbi:MAG TPA: chemotaxis protein CheW [Humisphaera sp.]